MHLGKDFLLIDRNLCQTLQSGGSFQFLHRQSLSVVEVRIGGHSDPILPDAVVENEMAAPPRTFYLLLSNPVKKHYHRHHPIRQLYNRPPRFLVIVKWRSKHRLLEKFHCLILLCFVMQAGQKEFVLPSLVVLNPLN